MSRAPETLRNIHVVRFLFPTTLSTMLDRIATDRWSPVTAGSRAENENIEPKATLSVVYESLTRTSAGKCERKESAVEHRCWRGISVSPGDVVVTEWSRRTSPSKKAKTGREERRELHGRKDSPNRSKWTALRHHQRSNWEIHEPSEKQLWVDGTRWGGAMNSREVRVLISISHGQAVQKESLLDADRWKSVEELSQHARIDDRRNLTDLLSVDLFWQLSLPSIVLRVDGNGEYPRSQTDPRLEQKQTLSS